MKYFSITLCRADFALSFGVLQWCHFICLGFEIFEGRKICFSTKKSRFSRSSILGSQILVTSSDVRVHSGSLKIWPQWQLFCALSNWIVSFEIKKFSASNYGLFGWWFRGLSLKFSNNYHDQTNQHFNE